MALAHGGSIGTGISANSMISVVTSAAVTAGAKIILSASGYVSGGTIISPSVTTAGGLTWTRQVWVQNLNASTNYCVLIFTADAPSGLASGTTLTITWDAGGTSVFGGCAGGVYITGAAAEGSAVDTTGTASGSGTGSRTVSVALTTTNAADYIYYHATCDGRSTTSAWTPAASYTEVTEWVEPEPFCTTNGYRIVAASGSHSPGSVCATNGPSHGGAIAIKEAGGGGGTPVTHFLASQGAGS